MDWACIGIFVIPNKSLVRWGIHYLKVKFGICDLMMTILMKWQFNSVVYYKIGLICKSEVNAGWWILEDMCWFWYKQWKSIQFHMLSILEHLNCSFWYCWNDLLSLFSILQWTMHCHPLKLRNQDHIQLISNLWTKLIMSSYTI